MQRPPEDDPTWLSTGSPLSVDAAAGGPIHVAEASDVPPPPPPPPPPEAADSSDPEEPSKDDEGVIRALLGSAPEIEAALLRMLRWSPLGTERLLEDAVEDHPEHRDAILARARGGAPLPLSALLAWAAPVIARGAQHVLHRRPNDEDIQGIRNGGVILLAEIINPALKPPKLDDMGRVIESVAPPPREIRDLAAFAWGIGRNRARNFLTQKGRQGLTMDPTLLDALDLSTAPPPPRPLERLFDRSDLEEILRITTPHLTARECQVLLLNMVGEHKTQAVADCLGCSDKNVRVQRKSIRDKVRDALAQIAKGEAPPRDARLLGEETLPDVWPIRAQREGPEGDTSLCDLVRAMDKASFPIRVHSQGRLPGDKLQHYPSSCAYRVYILATLAMLGRGRISAALQRSKRDTEKISPEQVSDLWNQIRGLALDGEVSAT